MQKILFLCLVGLLVLFNFQLQYGHGGYKDDNKVKQQILTTFKINADLKDRNNMMILKISGLKGSDDSLEARSRNELNLIKANEILVLLPGNDVNIKFKSQ